tara:strand:+ start:21133 stop:21633 length:501 start_codon:yes stop_codon:yes gene_type:complete
MEKQRIEPIKNNGFKVPDNYFNAFEQNMLSEIKLKEKINTSGFNVPKGYFESLDQTIHNLVVEKRQGKAINLFSWKKIAYATSIAASLILMFNVFFTKKEVLTLDSVETASIENYILNEDLETNEFASLFSKEDLANVSLINDGYSSQNLENYVFDNLEIDDITTN